MVEPNPANRYQNAEVALDALKPLYVIRLPEVNLDKLKLSFVADKLNQKLSQTITISNNIPETILEGNWSVSAHKNDPPHTPDSHSWISFSPQSFEGNQVNCEVRIDTSKLKADRNYEREIVLVSNAKQEEYPLKVSVKTAKINFNVPIPPYLSITVYYLVVALISAILGHGWLWIIVHESSMRGAIGGAIGGAIVVTIFGATIGGTIGGATIGSMMGGTIGSMMGGTIGGEIGSMMGWVIIGAMGWVIAQMREPPSEQLIFDKKGKIEGAMARAMFGMIFGGFGTASVITILVGISLGDETILMAISDVMGGAMGFIILVLILVMIEKEILVMIEKAIKGAIDNMLKRNFYDRGFRNDGVAFYVVTTTVVGILTGVGAAFGFNPYVLTGLGVTGIPLITLLLYSALNRRKLIKKYQEGEKHLIAP
jgi:hypothetical protein